MAFGKIKKDQFLNVLLRLLPLAAKLVLMLYMGRYFSLANMGIYGLVFGSVIILNTIVGQGFGFVVARDIVHVSPLTAAYKMRDQALLYGINYLGLIVASLVLMQTDIGSAHSRTILFTLLLTILEGYAGITNANMNSLNQQLMGNAMFFVRAGLWVVPVVVLGIIDPAWKTVDVVLISWIMGVAASLVITLWYWRGMPWRAVLQKSADWNWVFSGVKKSSLIWLGTLGLNGGTYVDRFVVEHFLSIDDVGVVTFYFSFASAMLTLMQSGVLAFAYPRLIAMHRDGHTAKFMHEARQALWQVALGAGLMALTLAVIVPLLGLYTERPALVNSSVTLWLMLFGSWVRSNAETLNYILYARHQDRAIWLGNLLFLIPAIGGNALLVPIIGLPGIGWATVVAAVFLLLWRWRHVGNINH
jgi:O-antigen/teichoic acid export membrane protein